MYLIASLKEFLLTQTNYADTESHVQHNGPNNSEMLCSPSTPLTACIRMIALTARGKL